MNLKALTAAIFMLSWNLQAQETAVAPAATYLENIAKLAKTDWPKNRALQIVCHGHSVPAGYFKTPAVHSLEAYPHLLRVGLAERYPHAVINVIVTAIGGENSTSGAARFTADVLSLKPDVVTIDYALNDRGIGLAAAKTNWIKMIAAAQQQGVKVILLTPTPDQSANLVDPQDPLVQHAIQIRALAAQYHTGVGDSLATFQTAIGAGTALAELMSQGNHPNAAGHTLVATGLLAWFPH
jgi:lysophospholipase L1-like esterase